MYNPVSTYRVQLHKGFTLLDLEGIIEYLHALGVKTIYASPIFAAATGSLHGYDVINPHLINPEVGDEEGLKNIIQKCHDKRMGWLQDIVPNHMAYHSENKWLMSVLETGRRSVFRQFFDIEKNAVYGYEKIMAPFLDSDLEEAIAQQKVRIGLKGKELKLFVNNQPYPLNPFSYATFFQLAQPVIPSKVTQWIIRVEVAEKINDALQFSSKWEELLANLEALENDAEVIEFMQLGLQKINESRDDLLQILEEQFYRLCYWRETERTINYRRFFTVNGLICLNVDQHTVFDFYHSYLKELLHRGFFDGLRIDHIDGLNDPAAYLQQLRNMSGDDKYIVIEKILQHGEELNSYWPIQGNTGYDFLSLVNNLLTYPDFKNDFYNYYAQLIDGDVLLKDQVVQKKSLILFQDMQGDLENLCSLFYELNLAEEPELNGITEELVKRAIAAFLIHCPVYRYYGNSFPLGETEAVSVLNILEEIKGVDNGLLPAVELLQKIFLEKPLNNDREFNDRVCTFYKRCMQFTGPLMAKGVEDTLMYTYNCFIVHNEVGNHPGSFGFSIHDFHNQMKERQKKWPLSLNSTSTHDTKRGEDARARLNILSELFVEWTAIVNELRIRNADLKVNGIPDGNEEYLIYQSMVANYPIHDRYNEDFNSRFKTYIQKALREAKIHTDWKNPDETYEKSVEMFIDKITAYNSACHKALSSFENRIVDHGIINSLTQLALKCTCPGVPDIYQGCESWNFSFVDPDNRRPVAYSNFIKWVTGFNAKSNGDDFLKYLWNKRADGEIKCWITQKLLQFRNQSENLFLKGEYIPLKTGGILKGNIIAFMRRHRNEVCILALPLYTALLCKNQALNIENLDWKDTYIEIPFDLHPVVENLLLEQPQQYEKKIFANDVFKPVPFFICKGKVTNSERAAGVLLHITSLPGKFAIGDLGPQAYDFTDFLSRSNQKIWQVLPLNPISESQGWSPYSSISSMAGNELLISPELLIADGFLDPGDLDEQEINSHVDFNLAKKIKDHLLSKAWIQFRQQGPVKIEKEFKIFKEDESEWVDDYALFILLKQINDQKPWYEWKPVYKNRNTEAILSFSKTYFDELEKQRWIQFMFFKQWKQLKTYCNNKGVQLFGDLSFYVSHDSVDVWANKEFFSIDRKGNRVFVAGVPPDAFSDEGQLWGMPVYNWKALKKANYKWWVERLKKNKRLFDFLRLDHFRAFADYWEIPANEATAKKGVWRKGPGKDFFSAMKKQLGELPFVAEDLGEITNDVYRLREGFSFPGMKVLQFAFNEKLPESIHAPHHHQLKCIVYTGTHDNNTLIGWISTELNEEGKRVLNKYAGIEVTTENIFEVLGRMAFSSVAEKVILPLQDWLGMDETARMNKPSSPEKNWGWKLLPGQIDEQVENKMREWTWLYNRD